MKILCVLSRYAYGDPARGENYDYVHFLPALRGLGHEVELFDSGERAIYSDFAELNVALLEQVNAFRPDILFCVLMHYEVWMETLDLIRANTPAAIVNWGTDDSWKFRQASRYFARHVDLHVTTDRAVAEGAPSLGLNNVLLSQWAASQTQLTPPLPSVECDYDVSFVGNLYGNRAKWIAQLRAAGINVHCFGQGSEHGVVDATAIPGIHRRSRLSLNFAGSGENSILSAFSPNRQIKARTFEVPGAGGFLLTEQVDGLDRYFDLDQDIATFDTPHDLIERARYFLSHPDVRDRMALAGYRKTSEHHTYAIRFAAILETLQQRVGERDKTCWSLSGAALAPAIARHRRSAGWLRNILTGPLTALFGKVRGPRAARRLMFEVSWRLCGEGAFQAGGLPGRLFFRES